MSKSFTDSLTLNDGNTIPLMGFGTAGLKGQEAEQSVADALELGCFRTLGFIFKCN